MTRLRLDAVAEPGLPPLAWCARMHRGHSEVAVRAGRDVVVSDDAIVEGAWDGRFSALDFDRAASLAGTGLRVAAQTVRFVAGSGRHDRLYATCRGDDLWVSNSLVYVWVAAGDAPDPRHRRHIHDLMQQVRTSRFERTPQSFRGCSGPVSIIELRDLEVDATLALRPVDKVALPTPRDFGEVDALLDGVVARTFENAADSSRNRRYRPLATVSRGYDSPATAALAARHGCREALTFAELRPGVPSPDDGTEVGEHLGLAIVRRSRDEWRARTDLPEAEVWACPPAMMMPLASVEADLPGRVLVTGRFGDRLFPPPFGPHGPPAVQSILSAPSSCEMKLRLGFVHFAPFFALRPHAARLIAMAGAPELAPWSVGGDYDRPIPRRIAETAGVPRDLFGMRKLAGAVDEVREPAELSPTSQRDFAAFVAATPGLSSDGKQRRRLLVHGKVAAARRLAARGAARCHLSLPPLLTFLPTTHDERLFQWGFARTRSRYDGLAP